MIETQSESLSNPAHERAHGPVLIVGEIDDKVRAWLVARGGEIVDAGAVQVVKLPLCAIIENSARYWWQYQVSFFGEDGEEMLPGLAYDQYVDGRDSRLSFRK